MVHQVSFVLHKEMLDAIAKFKAPGVTHFLVSVVLFIALNNVLGLAPYVFTSTAHLSVTAALVVPFAVCSPHCERWHNRIEHSSHLVPQGAPLVLGPFLVFIEVARLTIRPMTLAIRLAANIIAGHLLLALLAGPAPLVSYPVLVLILGGLILIRTLEIAVSFIQAYVFGTLRSMYLGECNRVLNHVTPYTL